MNENASTSTVQSRLETAARDGSKADRTLASYMLAQLNGLAFETAASLAGHVGVSEPTVGRFCRSIGYKSFKALKAHLRDDLGDKPWLIRDRLGELQARARAGEDHLAKGLELEIAGLVSVYELAHSAPWAAVAKRLATSSQVYVAGFQTERGVAQIFANQLHYLRDEVHLLDVAGGNFSQMLLSDTPDRCLVVFEARRYSRLARVLMQEATAAGIPVTLVTDPFCDWGREVSDEMFVVPTRFGQFWESNALMASLANLLVNSVFLEIGPTVEARFERIQALHAGFTGYADGSGPSSGDTPIVEPAPAPKSQNTAAFERSNTNNNDNRDKEDDISHTHDARNSARDTGPDDTGNARRR